jgi:hypothetical protein
VFQLVPHLRRNRQTEARCLKHLPPVWASGSRILPESVTDYHNGGTSASPDEGTFAISGMSSVLAGPPSILDGAPTLDRCRHRPDSALASAVGTSSTQKPSSFQAAGVLDTASIAGILSGSRFPGPVLIASG